MGDYDISKSFWKHLKSKFLDDNTKKIKVSDYVKEELFKLDVGLFNEKYSCKLQNVKKDKVKDNVKDKVRRSKEWKVVIPTL